MDIEISQLLRAIRRWWWVPVVTGLVLGLLGFGGGYAVGSTTYTASTQMLVTEQIAGDEVLSSESRTQTYLALVTSGPVLDRVVLELGLDYTRQEMGEEIVEASTINGTQIIEIHVTTGDPQLSADIANSISRNFVVTATDLSVGELQRNLEDLRQQANTIRDQIIVIDARLAEIDTEENAENAQLQAEITQLERERLQASQTLADLDRSIRELTTNLNTMSIPVVVTDFAQPPNRSEGGVSPMLLALLGAFLGALLGAAWIAWWALSDRKLRAPGQVVSQPLLARIRREDLSAEDANAVELLAAKLMGLREASGTSFVLASARNSNSAAELRRALAKENAGNLGDVVAADSVLTNAGSMQTASIANHVVVVADSDESNIDDLEELVQVLAAMKTGVLGTILVD